MKSIIAALFFLVFSAFSANSFAIDSYCDNSGNDTFYHVATMNAWEQTFPYTRTQIATDVSGPVSPALSNTWNAVNSWHIFPSMPAGNYTWAGESTLEIGDIGDVWEAVGFDFCYGSHSVVALPSNLSIDVSPNTVVVGQSFTVAWSSSGADFCTFESTTIATSGNVTVPSATHADEKTYSITCTNSISGTSGPVSDSLVVDECSDSSSPSPIYSGSSYNPSFFTSVSPYIGGGRFGLTDVGGYTQRACVEVCSGGNTRYRLEGGAVTDSNSFMKVSTHLEPISGSSCTVPVARTGSNIVWTEDHEIIHANGVKSVFDTYNAAMQSSPLYTSYGLCDAASNTWLAGFQSALSAEYSHQDAHGDHSGLSRHGTSCLSGVLTEVPVSPYP